MTNVFHPGPSPLDSFLAQLGPARSDTDDLEARAAVRTFFATDDDGHEPPDVDQTPPATTDQTPELLIRNLFRQTDQEDS